MGLQRLLDAAQGLRGRAHLVERQRQGARRAERAAPPPAPAARMTATLVAPAEQAQSRHRTQRAYARRRVGRGVVVFEHGTRQPVAQLDAVPDPVVARRGRQPQARLRIDRPLAAPGERGDQVLVFLPEAAHPERPARARARAARPPRPTRRSGPHAGHARPRLRRTRSGDRARTGAPSRASGSGGGPTEASRSTTSSDLSCSTVNSASASYSSAVCATSAAACSVQPPAKTDIWRSKRCSGGASCS